MTDLPKCTLSSFLDAPNAAPPRDWLDAASRSNSPANPDSEAFLLRASEALEQAEQSERNIANLEHARTAKETTDHATGLLAAVFNVNTARAFDCLAWVAQESGTTLDEVADAFTRRAVALGSDAHDREALLGLLNKLAERRERRAG